MEDMDTPSVGIQQNGNGNITNDTNRNDTNHDDNIGFSNILEFTNKLNDFMENKFISIKKDDEYIQDLSLNANAISVVSKHERIIISVIGPPNSGKSLFLNKIIGNDLLPIFNDEKKEKAKFLSNIKPIVIRNLPDQQEGIELKVCKLDHQYLNMKKEYFIKELDQSLYKESNQIKNAIKNGLPKLNDKNYFYMIKTNIKYLEVFELEQNLKNNIDLIFIPNLNSRFNRDLAEKLSKDKEINFDQNIDENSKLNTSTSDNDSVPLFLINRQKEIELKLNNLKMEDIDPIIKLLGISNINIFMFECDTDLKKGPAVLMLKKFGEIMKIYSGEKFDYLRNTIFLANKSDKIKPKNRKKEKIVDSITELIDPNKSVSSLINLVFSSTETFKKYVDFDAIFESYTSLYQHTSKEYEDLKISSLFNNYYTWTLNTFINDFMEVSFSDTPVRFTKDKDPKDMIIESLINTEEVEKFCGLSTYKSSHKDKYCKLIIAAINFYKRNKEISQILKDSGFIEIKNLIKPIVSKVKSNQKEKILKKLRQLLDKIKNFYDFGQNNQKGLNEENKSDLIEKCKSLKSSIEEIIFKRDFRVQYSILKSDIEEYFNTIVREPGDSLKELGGDIEKALEKIKDKIKEKMKKYEDNLEENSKNMQKELENKFNEMENLFSQIDIRFNKNIISQDVNLISVLTEIKRLLISGVSGLAGLATFYFFLGIFAFSGTEYMVLVPFAALGGGIIGLGIGLAGAALFTIGKAIHSVVTKTDRFKEHVIILESHIEEILDSMQLRIFSLYESIVANILEKTHEEINKRTFFLFVQDFSQYNNDFMEFNQIVKEFEDSFSMNITK